MRDYYLSVLGLGPTATEDNIKSAFRGLSKTYHPDINPTQEGTTKFLQIKEAYEYLNETPTFNEPVSSFEDQMTDEELWRMEYQRWARKKKLEKQHQELQLINKMLFYFRPGAMIILIFNLLLVIDFLLPLSDHNQTIQGISRMYEYRRSGGSVYRYDEIYFDDFTMRLDKGSVALLDHYDHAVVRATAIFSKPMYAVITIEGAKEIHKQIYNVYHVFGYLIPILSLLSMAFFRLRKPHQRLNIAIVLLIFGIIQLILFTI